ncbi:hypothetical protein CYMTET_36696, partial [Cymbomonas tetramitiformis]
TICEINLKTYSKTLELLSLTSPTEFSYSCKESNVDEVTLMMFLQKACLFGLLAKLCNTSLSRGNRGVCP